jgi:hypothetical protein
MFHGLFALEVTYRGLVGPKQGRHGGSAVLTDPEGRGRVGLRTSHDMRCDVDGTISRTIDPANRVTLQRTLDFAVGRSVIGVSKNGRNHHRTGQHEGQGEVVKCRYSRWRRLSPPPSQGVIQVNGRTN